MSASLTEKTAEKALSMLGLEETESLQAFAEAAVTNLLSRLKAGSDPAAFEGLFTTAAALYTVSLYEKASLGGVNSFSAGNISVSMAKGCENASDILLSAYLKDTDFVFKGV